jgi:GT2 family glycosyltransferase
LALEAVAAGLRVLRRHLRYARREPAKLFWIARRVVEIVATGRLSAVLERHRAAGDASAEYKAWLETESTLVSSRRAALERELAYAPAKPCFSILMPVFAPRQEFLRAALDSVTAQSYAQWELCIVDDASTDRSHIDGLLALARDDPRVRVHTRAVNSGIAAATNDALALATGEFVLFLDQDDLLDKDALLHFAAVALHVPEVAMIFADEDRIGSSSKRGEPFFKPGLDAEWLLTTNCVLHPFVVRTAWLRSTGGMALGVDGAQDWELALRSSDQISADRIVHVPRVLYHWREHAGSTAAAIYEKPAVVDAQLRVMQAFHARRGERVSFTHHAGGWRIDRPLPQPAPRVCIVVPTRDRADLMRRCVDGLRTWTDYPNWECVVVDNGSREPAALTLLETLRADPAFNVVRDDGDFNYARLCNVGAAAAGGEILVLLNNDVEPLNPTWLTQLVVNVVRPEIGLAGAMLYYPNRTIQHAGVVLWLNGVADRPYIGLPRGYAGIDHRLAAVHSVSALVTACVAVRRMVYEEVGGMDVAFPVACNDLDLCLRVSEAGYRNIITPHAELFHRESASRGYDYGTRISSQAQRDEELFRERWNVRIPVDPFYNVNFTREGPAFRIRHPGS